MFFPKEFLDTLSPMMILYLGMLDFIKIKQVLDDVEPGFHKKTGLTPRQVKLEQDKRVRQIIKQLLELLSGHVYCVLEGGLPSMLNIIVEYNHEHWVKESIKVRFPDAPKWWFQELLTRLSAACDGIEKAIRVSSFLKLEELVKGDNVLALITGKAVRETRIEGLKIKKTDLFLYFERETKRGKKRGKSRKLKIMSRIIRFLEKSI